MKTIILHYYYGAMDGVFISTMDLYYNLSKYMDVEYRIITDKPTDCIKHLFKNNNSDLVPFVTKDKIVKADTIICSARFLLHVKLHEICECKKLIILDSLDLIKLANKIFQFESKHYKFNIYDLIPSHFKKKDVIFLCNPANFKSRFKFTMVEYFQKMSQERTNKFPKKYGRYIEDYNEIGNPFLQAEFNYTRITKPWMSMEDGTFFENTGRLIFEHLHAGKIVNYSSEGMHKKDGLYYYLGLFGIDGAKDHMPLKISKEEIEDVLFMKEDDPIIELLS